MAPRALRIRLHVGMGRIKRLPDIAVLTGEQAVYTHFNRGKNLTRKPSAWFAPRRTANDPPPWSQNDLPVIAQPTIVSVQEWIVGIEIPFVTKMSQAGAIPVFAPA